MLIAVILLILAFLWAVSLRNERFGKLWYGTKWDKYRASPERWRRLHIWRWYISGAYGCIGLAGAAYTLLQAYDVQGWRLLLMPGIFLICSVACVIASFRYRPSRSLANTPLQRKN